MLLKRCLLLCFIFCLGTTAATSQTVNIDAVNKYWELTARLRQNLPVTDPMWNDFINMEGNKTYAHSEFTDKDLAYYRRAIELVYMPANDSLLQVNLKKNNWYCLLAKRYKDEEQALKRYLADTVLKPSFFNSAYQYVYEYLPVKFQHPVADLHLYYNCLSNDAVSYPNGLFFSLLSEIDNAKVKSGTLEAHELHHRLRQNIDMDGGRDTAMTARNAGLIWAMNAIPNEGIADMIDKAPTLAVAGDPEGIGEWLLDPAPGTLQQLDSCIRMMALDTANHQSSRYYRNLLKNTTGHMPGFYMAGIIVRNGLKKQMIDGEEHPFNFFYTYNKAAGKDASKPFVFSAESMQYLKKLERAILRK